jgi:hypothetical protein
MGFGRSSAVADSLASSPRPTRSALRSKRLLSDAQQTTLRKGPTGRYPGLKSLRTHRDEPRQDGLQSAAGTVSASRCATECATNRPSADRWRPLAIYRRPAGYHLRDLRDCRLQLAGPCSPHPPHRPGGRRRRQPVSVSVVSTRIAGHRGVCSGVRVTYKSIPPEGPTRRCPAWRSNNLNPSTHCLRGSTY